jgi:hypothetical protein
MQAKEKPEKGTIDRSDSDKKIAKITDNIDLSYDILVFLI